MKEDFGYAKVLFGVIVGLALGIVIGMWFPPSTFKIPEACNSQSFWCWLDRWQTLIAGGATAFIAFWIGFSQLRPLVKSQRLTARNDHIERTAKCVDFNYFLEVSIDDIRTARAYFFTVDEKTDIWTFVGETPEMKNVSTYEALLNTLMAKIRRTQIETLKFPIYSDSAQELSDAKTNWFEATSSARKSAQDFRNKLVNAYNESYPSRSKPHPENDEESFVIGFVKDALADGSLKQLEETLKGLEGAYERITEALSLEIFRRDALVAKPIH